MFVTIEMLKGRHGESSVNKNDIQRNINALDKAMKNTSSIQTQLLMDTKSLLLSIQKQLPRSG